MIDFSEKWDAISGTGHSAERLRIAPDHHLDLFIGFALNGMRTFMLESDVPVFGSHELPTFENIDLRITPTGNGQELTLQLSDPALSDLFSAISSDLVDASSRADTQAGAAQIFVNRLKRWSELLKEGRTKGMTEAEQLGLLGELSFLNWVAEEKIINLDPLIRGWRGPDGDARDIALGALSVEVKAKRNTSKNVLRISSLDQLDTEGRNLAIVLYRYSSADNGVSLERLSEQMMARIQSNQGSLRNFMRKLYLTGYDPEADYISNYYELNQTQFYDVRDDFPRLVKGNMPTEIRSAKYEIDCSQIKDYEITASDLVRMIHGQN